MKIIPQFLILTILTLKTASLILKLPNSAPERLLRSKPHKNRHNHKNHKNHKNPHKPKNYLKKLIALTKLQSLLKRNLIGLPGADLGGGTGGSIKAGDVDIKFPPLPEALTAPININTPAAAYPQVVADPQRQKPIVVVPELIYPHKVKRVIVHHNQSLHDYYSAMTHQMNPVYGKMAMMNPYYADTVAGSTGFNSMMLSQPMSQMMGSLDKHFKI